MIYTLDDCICGADITREVKKLVQDKRKILEDAKISASSGRRRKDSISRNSTSRRGSLDQIQVDPEAVALLNKELKECYDTIQSLEIDKRTLDSKF